MQKGAWHLEALTICTKSHKRRVKVRIISIHGELMRLWWLACLAVVSTSCFAEGYKDLGDFMSPDEIAEEAAMNGDYSMLRQDAARTGVRWRPLRIVVTKSTQSMQVVLNDEVYYTWKVSTGRNRMERAPSGRKYFTATPVGYFTINSRTKMHRSQTWGGARMPHAQFFTGGVAVHGTTPDHFDELGRPAGSVFKTANGRKKVAGSGGCVRLHPDNGAILYELVTRVGVNDTLIVVQE